MVDTVAVHPAHLTGDRPTYQLIGKIKALELIGVFSDMLCLGFTPVLSAPVLYAGDGLVPRDAKRDDHFRQLLGAEIILSDQRASAEGAAAHGLPFLNDKLCAAARTAGTKQTPSGCAFANLRLLNAPKALFHCRCFGDTNLSSAVSA